MERGNGEFSAIQEVHERYAIPVASIITLENIVAYLQERKDLAHHLPAIERYRQRYGTA
jgi:orotate phosphoribosyltransferase